MLEGNGDSLPHSEIDESRNGKKDPILLIMNVTYYLFAGTFTHPSVENESFPLGKIAFLPVLQPGCFATSTISLVNLQ